MFAHLNPQSSDFGDISALQSPFLHQFTVQSSLFEHWRLRPCPSYGRRRDRINLGLFRSLYKGGGGGVSTLLLGETCCVAPGRRGFCCPDACWCQADSGCDCCRPTILALSADTHGRRRGPPPSPPLHPPKPVPPPLLLFCVRGTSTGTRNRWRRRVGTTLDGA